MSTGVKDSPSCPPIVPLIPDMDLINVTEYYVFIAANVEKSCLPNLKEKF
jgi:hypothetical protein